MAVAFLLGLPVEVDARAEVEARDGVGLGVFSGRGVIFAAPFLEVAAGATEASELELLALVLFSVLVEVVEVEAPFF